MNKKIKRLLISFFFLLFTINTSNASLLWDIEYGINQFRQDNFKFAQKYFRDYLISNPNDENGYYWLARTYSKLKNNKEADVNYKKAYEITKYEKNIEKIDFHQEIKADIEDYFDMSTAYFESGDYKKAENYADMMLKINPKSSSAYFIKAKIAKSNNQNSKAIENLNKAILINNKLIETNLAKKLNITKVPELSKEMYELLALETYFSQDINSAIKYTKKYLAMNENNIDMINLLIDLYIKNNDLISAQSLISDNENTLANIQTKLYQAQIYKLKKDERQLKTLQDAYNINPNNAQVILELGNYYLSIKDYRNSKRYFETLINVDDSMYEGYFGYIYSLCELNDLDNATNLIRKFISLNKESSEGYYLLAKICEKNGNFEESLSYLSEAIKKTTNPKYYLDRAKINYILKNYDKSLIDLEVLSKISIHNIEQKEIDELCLRNYIKLKDIEKAQKLLTQKNSLDKKTLIYKYNLYILYKLQDNNYKAIELFNELKKTKLTNSENYIDLSEIYLEEGNKDTALKILDKGIKKYSKESALYSQKVKILSLFNRQNEIKSTLKKSIEAQDN